MLALLMVAWSAVVVPGARAGPDEVANSVSREIMSPFCPGLTLHDCPSDAAADLRARIERWAEAGWTSERIIEKLESEYGPGIRAAPPADDQGLVAWLVPALVVVLGGLILWVLLRRWTRRRPPPEPSRVEISPEERARLETELHALRSQS